MPRHVRLNGVRADSGFCLPELLALWEQRKLPYVVPGYRFQALVTSLPQATHPPLAVWRYYNGRADCENVINCLRKCWQRSSDSVP